MPFGDPDRCRLVVRRPDGELRTRQWAEDEWPPQIGQLVHEEDGLYRVASVGREGDVTVVTALPAGRAVRRL